MGSRSLSRSPGHALLLKFHHLPKVENRMEGERESCLFFHFACRKKRKRTYDYLIVTNDHRVHAPVWCTGLALIHRIHSRTLHSRPGLPDLLVPLPPSTIAAVEVLLVMTAAAPDFLLSQKANTGQSAFPASSFSWTRQRLGDAWPQFSDPQANAKLLCWISNQCICPPHNKLEIKCQETWQSLPLLKTCSLPPPCKMTYRFSSSTKCFRHYLNLQHHERPEWWTSCTALDTVSQAG